MFVLFLTWAIMGLWHGVNWTFVLWGLYHATLIAVYRFVSPVAKFWPENLTKFVGWVMTIPVIMLSWIPFRAENIGEAFSMWGKALSLSQFTWLGMRENTYLVAAFIFVAGIAIYFVRKWYAKISERDSTLAMVSQMVLESIVFAWIIGLAFIYLRPIQQFIYFQF